MALFFMYAWVGLFLLSGKIKKMMGWSLDQINAKTYYVRVTTENGRKVQLRWIFNGSHLVGMDKRGNLELPRHGKDVYWRRHERDDEDVYKFSWKDSKCYLVGHFEHSPNQVWGQGSTDCWLQHIIDNNNNQFLLQFLGGCRVEPEDGKFFVIYIRDDGNTPVFKLGDYNLAKKNGVFSLASFE